MNRLFLLLVMLSLMASYAFAETQATPKISPPLPPPASPIAPGKSGGPSSSASAATNSNAITPAQWQELRTAREAAIKANPALIAKSMELAQKMRAFQQKLDAAIIQDDPGLAPMIDKLEHGMNAQHMPPPMTSALPHPVSGQPHSPGAQDPAGPVKK